MTFYTDMLKSVSSNAVVEKCKISPTFSPFLSCSSNVCNILILSN
jgi:hypothetical protein